MQGSENSAAGLYADKPAVLSAVRHAATVGAGVGGAVGAVVGSGVGIGLGGQAFEPHAARTGSSEKGSQ